MIEGLILGTLAFASIILTWSHMPEWFKNYTRRHPFFSDILTSAIAFFFLSGISKSLIAVVGSIFAGLLMSALLVFANWGNHEHAPSLTDSKR